VLLDHRAADRTTADQSRTTGDHPGEHTDVLIAALQEQVADLREQLRDERQGHAEARRLLAAALSPSSPTSEKYSSPTLGE
jgi:hypothetical protein